ncbi:MAG: ParB/RepB/Spo0J family partition protein [Chloroflexi bacterium]|jgi:ParB family chromosome partitioning protein|nr:ParB/RepB/Spo0J family partition protein [Chloroflexota bacterium]
MTPRSGLGKGLDALIPASSQPQEGILQVPVDSVRRNPRQPRMHFDPQELEELTASVREHGILQPLIVSAEADGSYTLIAGERRLEAARRAGLRTVPVLVRQIGERGRLELALIENLQRADLNPLEEAEAYRQLHEEFGLSHEEIARRVGKSRVAITNTLRLLGLAQPLKQALLEGAISEGHARALLTLSTPEAQVAALRTVLQQGLTVRQTEELVRKLSGERPQPKPARLPPPEIQALEERLRASLGTKVSLRHSRKGGVIAIHYYSEEELNALLEKLLD